MIRLFTFLFMLWAPMALAKTLTIVADEWCPYNCKPNSANPGYIVEIVREIFEPRGYKVEYSVMTWSRALLEVERGRSDGAIAATPYELPNGIFSDRPIGYYTNHFFSLKENNWVFNGLESLKQVSLAVFRGYDYGVELNEYIKQNLGSDRIVMFEGEEDPLRIMQLLYKGRIDVYLEDKDVGLYFIKQLGIEQDIQFSYSGQSNPLYLALTPVKSQSKEHAKILSEGIYEMRKTGRLKKILDKYGLEDWQRE